MTDKQLLNFFRMRAAAYQQMARRERHMAIAIACFMRGDDSWAWYCLFMAEVTGEGE